MRKPTIKQLEKLNACTDGIEWYKSVESKSAQSIIDGANFAQLRFCNWYIARALSSDNKIRYSIYAAEKVLHIFEDEYPGDDRPREAIQAAKYCLAGEIDEYSARATAYDAARAAADSARATADSARATAFAAADSAARAEENSAYAAHAFSDLLRDIIKYGLSLMGEQ